MTNQPPPVLIGAQPSYAAFPERVQDAYQLGRATVLIKFLLNDLNTLIAKCPDDWSRKWAERTASDAASFLTEEGIRYDERAASLAAFLAKPVLDDAAGPL